MSRDNYKAYCVEANSQKRERLARLVIEDFLNGDREDLPPDIKFMMQQWKRQDDEIGPGCGIKDWERREYRKDAVRYILWAEAGFIDDKRSPTTIVNAFAVDKTKVPKWKKDLSGLLPAPHQDRAQMAEKLKTSRGYIRNDLNPGENLDNPEWLHSTPEGLVTFFMRVSGKRYRMSLNNDK